MLAAFILLAQAAEENVPKGGGEQPGLPQMMIPIMLMLAAFFFIVILPAQRKEKKQRELIYTTLKKNDKVLTSSGIIGVVQDIRPEDDEFTIKLDENCKVRMKKTSIVQILKTKDETPAAK